MEWSSGVSFKGTDRFTVRRRLGSGGMGVVYEVHDHLAKQDVALKTLLHAESSAVYRLKNEFRALANIAHPNLVSLFELFMEGDICFFTMELLKGVDFVRYARGHAHLVGRAKNAGTLSASTTLPESPELPREVPVPAAPEPRRSFASPANSDRLRRSLRQLADGLCALHDVGKLHRDVKPSNVLVTDDRVVILDFGLSTEFVSPVSTTGCVGTPAYMSPEQMEGRALLPASDWYGVGVTLYEALTGQLPYEGGYSEVLTKKQQVQPVPPSLLVDGPVDHDLEKLCLALLHRDPAARPSGREVLERLSREDSVVLGAPVVPKSAFIVGRDGHLSRLRAAFEAASRGATIKIYIDGSSGMGKSTLARNFIKQLEEGQQALVLSGRCYERESIPFKALDGVVDQLSHYLTSLPEIRVEALLPRDVSAIAQMFPVLGRVKCIAGCRSSGRDVSDPLTVRRRAFNSFREFLGRISDRLPLVIFIDDLHWADADSMALLEHVLRPPDAPALLMLATLRTEESGSNRFLKSLSEENGTEQTIAMHLGRLTDEEGRELTLSLLGSDTPSTDQFVETLVREAQGNPFLIEQLVHWAACTHGVGTHTVGVTEMLEARMRQLPEGARSILETLALAARPMPLEVVFQATGVSQNRQSIVALLRSGNLLRSSGTAQKVELCHDRIRESIASLISPDRTLLIHSNLAKSLVTAGFDDPEVLFEHYLRACEVEQAAQCAKLAAAKASAALAFDRAAAFYRSALTLLPPDSRDSVELKPQLGDSLANAGRPADAARMYLEATLEAEPNQALELQRRAAEQFLLGGHVDEGLDVIRMVLDRVGLRLVSGLKTALASLLLRRFELFLRGLRFTERRASDIPATELLRIDICWTVAAGLAMVDNIRGADFQTRHLLLALRAGEPYRIARAMAVEAGFSATSGAPGRQRALRFSRIAEELSARVGHPHAAGLTKLTAGVAKFLVGEWKRSFELCEASEEILRDQCTGSLWEQTSAQNFILGSLLYMGELKEIKRRLPSMLSTASERGNLYAATELKTRMNAIWLVDDDPDRARREVAEALQLWSHKGFYRQHYNAVLAEAQIALYTGDGRTAWDCVISCWPDLRRAMLLRIQVLRIEALFLKARSALAVAERNPAQAPVFLPETERLARAIEREHMHWSDPLAFLLRAGVAVLRRDCGRAVAVLAQAIPGFESAGMALHAAVARWRLGELQNSTKDCALVAQAAEWMASQDVKNPIGIMQMLAPGFTTQPVPVSFRAVSSRR